MTTPLSLVKPQILELAPYTLRHYEPRIKLNQNESPYDVPAELKRLLWERLADRPWNRYPPFVANDFIAAVSDATGWDPSGVLVGNGSNELIQALLATVVGAETSVVVPEPTFTLYRLLTGIGGGTVHSVPLDAKLRFDIDAIIATARRTSARVIVLCSPNNPTGGSVSRVEIVRLHDETDALVILDQAYVEFGGYDAISLLAERSRLIVLRTFSKAMSMAGLRAGFLLGDPSFVAQVSKAKLPYNLNFVTETVAAEVLRNRDLLWPQIETIRSERDRLFLELSKLDGLTVFPSDANFILFRVERTDLDHRELFGRLLDEHGVLVRDVSGYPMLDHCLRVNAGTPAENDEFLAGVRAVLGVHARPAAVEGSS